MRITGVPDPRDDGLASLIAAGEAHWQGGKPAGARIRLSEQGSALSELVVQGRE